MVFVFSKWSGKSWAWQSRNCHLDLTVRTGTRIERFLLQDLGGIGRLVQSRVFA